MRLLLVARNPTDSVTHGFLPAAARLGAQVLLLTDQPDAHRRAYADHPHPPAVVLGAEVGDARELAAIATDVRRRHGLLDAIVSNSDHLQAEVALAAAHLGLPGKPWAAAVRTKRKALMRAHLAEAGLDEVGAVELGPDGSLPAHPLLDRPGPFVLKPREGVASEEVRLVADATELAVRAREVLRRRPGTRLLVEEYLDGPVRTLETLGSVGALRVLGGFRTRLGPQPWFAELGLDWDPVPGPGIVDQVLAQLRALGVGLGACHTEYTVLDGRARLIEVNYRLIGDQCDLMLADLLGEDVFGLVLRAHLGEDVATLAPRPVGTVHGHARADYVCAGSNGVLSAAPAAEDRGDAGEKVLLRYRPLRAPGERITCSGSNRDYLGVVRAVGVDPPAVDRAVEDFIAGHDWTVAPAGATS